jgi:hypothetical protein
MVWPYLPFSDALEHEPACAMVAALTVRIATAAATVCLQNRVFIVATIVFTPSSTPSDTFLRTRRGAAVTGDVNFEGSERSMRFQKSVARICSAKIKDKD